MSYCDHGRRAGLLTQNKITMKNFNKLILLCLLVSGIAKAETEPNDTWNQANVITIGSAGTGTSGLNLEEDWWRVTIPGDGMLTINWTAVNSLYVWCEVFDTLGSIPVVTGTYTNASQVHNIDGLAKGTYYVKFHSFYSTDATNYSFTPTFTAASVANDATPNETSAAAGTFPLNGTINGHINYYYNNHRDTLDWWKITVAQDGLLSYTLTSNNGDYVYAQLFDGDAATQLAGNYTNTTATYTKDGMAPGVYYIKVFTFYSTEFSPYTISNTFTPPVSGNESSPNNETPATAATLPLNGSVTGHIGFRYNGNVDVVDWWKVNVTADGQLFFTITSDNGQNVYAELFDGDATTYLAGSYTVGTATYNTNGLAPGIYYIRVRTFYASEFASYQLSNSLTVPLEANDAGSNDTYLTGTVISPNGTHTGHIGYRYNANVDVNDWYKITLPADGKIDFSITSNPTPPANATQNVYALLYDGDGVGILAGSYTISTSSFSKDGLAAGTYYINIHTFYGVEFAPYTLTTSFTPAALTNDAEPNGTLATAITLSTGSTVTGHTGYYYNGNDDTLDIYALTLPLDGKLNWTITSGNGSNTYALLYDHDGTTLLGGSYTTTSATYQLNNLAAGTYYMVVRNFILMNSHLIRFPPRWIQ